jgi:hypothetical protein
MTNESKLRDVIADVRALRGTFVGSNDGRYVQIEQKLAAIERKLGGLLPPIGGTFTINLDTVIKPR